MNKEKRNKFYKSSSVLDVFIWSNRSTVSATNINAYNIVKGNNVNGFRLKL